MEKTVIVVGGGAAGFFSAINIAEKCPSYKVIILEKTTKVLTKVKVSGGGRCNVTHACFEPKELSTYYPRGERELLGPFHSFMSGDTIEWFANRGVELKMEEDGRMFPESNSSQTIINCFLKLTQKLGIEIKTSTEITEVFKKEQFLLEVKGGGKLVADYLIIATGGSAKKKHYELVENLGHSIDSPIPSLFTFNLPKHASNQLMGLALDASVSILGTKYEEYGPVLFTHWGMSGPAILKLSSKAAQFLFDRSYQFKYKVQWHSNAEDLIDYFRKETSKQQIGNSKVESFPARFWDYLIVKSNVDRTKRWADLNKNELSKLIHLLSNDEYEANGKTTFKEEFVSCGGIRLREINMKTMESKIVPDLYFCGELMNIDGYTGGFNFQAAWTTGYLVSEGLYAKS
ncbi:MAG: NAD(P)/FAD-dependent oxidoreductase [Flavobacteriales bacterium]|nr:NAD(P)/FAD-dependent oxidoreductase [Flavobacteriales bacterium]